MTTGSSWMKPSCRSRPRTLGKQPALRSHCHLSSARAVRRTRTERGENAALDVALRFVAEVLPAGIAAFPTIVVIRRGIDGLAITANVAAAVVVAEQLDVDGFRHAVTLGIEELGLERQRSFGRVVRQRRGLLDLVPAQSEGVRALGCGSYEGTIGR